LEEAEKEMERNKSQRSNYAQRDTVEGNLDNLLIRLTQRGYFPPDSARLLCPRKRLVRPRQLRHQAAV